MLPSANKPSKVSQAILLQSSLRGHEPSVHTIKVPQLHVRDGTVLNVLSSWDYLATVILRCAMCVCVCVC